MSGNAGEPFRKERYIVYDFLIGNPILIDRAEKTLTFFHRNLCGQVYNLADERPKRIGGGRIAGLIRRTHNPNYYRIELVIDSYIYAYFMTPAERAMCKAPPPRTYDLHKYIVATDDYGEAVREMCEWVYEHECEYNDKDERREERLQYYRAYLMKHPAPPAPAAASKMAQGKNRRPRPGVSR